MKKKFMRILRAVSYPYRYAKAFLRLRQAVILADEHYTANHIRYYVMPTADRKLLVMNRNDLKRLRQKHYIHHRVTTHDLVRECFYHTPHALGTGFLPPDLLAQKRAAYFRWSLQ